MRVEEVGQNIFYNSMTVYKNKISGKKKSREVRQMFDYDF